MKKLIRYSSITLLAGASVCCLLASVGDADARGLIPARPSVEVRLEALRALRDSVGYSAQATAPRYVPAIPQGSPVPAPPVAAQQPPVVPQPPVYAARPPVAPAPSSYAVKPPLYAQTPPPPRPAPTVAATPAPVPVVAHRTPEAVKTPPKPAVKAPPPPQDTFEVVEASPQDTTTMELSLDDLMAEPVTAPAPEVPALDEAALNGALESLDNLPALPEATLPDVSDTPEPMPPLVEPQPDVPPVSTLTDASEASPPPPPAHVKAPKKEESGFGLGSILSLFGGDDEEEKAPAPPLPAEPTPEPEPAPPAPVTESPALTAPDSLEPDALPVLPESMPAMPPLSELPEEESQEKPDQEPQEPEVETPPSIDNSLPETLPEALQELPQDALPVMPEIELPLESLPSLPDAMPEMAQEPASSEASPPSIELPSLDTLPELPPALPEDALPELPAMPEADAPLESLPTLPDVTEEIPSLDALPPALAVPDAPVEERGKEVASVRGDRELTPEEQASAAPEPSAASEMPAEQESETPDAETPLPPKMEEAPATSPAPVAPPKPVKKEGFLPNLGAAFSSFLGGDEEDKAPAHTRPVTPPEPAAAEAATGKTEPQAGGLPDLPDFAAPGASGSDSEGLPPLPDFAAASPPKDGEQSAPSLPPLPFGDTAAAEQSLDTSEPAPQPAEQAQDEVEQQLASLPAPELEPLPEGGVDAMVGAPADAPTLSVVFAQSETEVPLAYQQPLITLSKELVANPQAAIKVVAYASASEDQKSVARHVSFARALAVRALLIDLGVDNMRISVQALVNESDGGEPERADIFVDDNG